MVCSFQDGSIGILTIGWIQALEWVLRIPDDPNS